MRVILCPFGSHGDVHPFVGLGKGLLARGHQVILVAAEPFRGLAERAGLIFAGIGTVSDYESLITNPQLWSPRKGLRVIFDNEHIVGLYRDQLAHIQSHTVEGDTVLVAGTLAFAARVAQELFSIPLVTVHLQPGILFSVDSPAIYPQSPLRPWWPHWMRRGFYRMADHITDRPIKTKLNHWRKELSLPPVKRILSNWGASPQRIIGLFPQWYAHAPDWPQQLVQCGFIRYDQEELGIPPSLERFLQAGDPPVIFSFGSAMRTGKTYFEAAAKACEQIGCRGLILAKGGEQIPRTLPENVAHFDYAPFSQVFPRGSVVVHHGGIGTTAQALAAGVPQLVMPMSFDQPDNAARVTKLGVGRTLVPRKFTPKRLGKVLMEMRNDTAMKTRCQNVKQEMARDNALITTCETIEASLRA